MQHSKDSHPVTLRSCLVAVFALCAALVAAPALQAQTPFIGTATLDPAVVRVAEALHLPEVFEVMAAEGRDYGATLEQEMFPGVGGADWAADVDRIYATQRTYPAFLRAFSARLSGNAALPEIERFLASDLGRKASMLEVSARRAMLAPEVEEAARMRFAELAGSDDLRYRLVENFIDANDLVEVNVAGGLNAARAFYSGLSQGGAFEAPMAVDQILQEVWSQEPVIRSEAENWLGSVLNMAYAPLTEAEMRAYIAASEGKAMHVLNGALYEAFDQSFTSVSEDLGRSAAKYIAGETL